MTISHDAMGSPAQTVISQNVVETKFERSRHADHWTSTGAADLTLQPLALPSEHRESGFPAPREVGTHTPQTGRCSSSSGALSALPASPAISGQTWPERQPGIVAIDSSADPLVPVVEQAVSSTGIAGDTASADIVGQSSLASPSRSQPQPSSPMKVEQQSAVQLVPGQKRTIAGDFKPISSLLESNGSGSSSLRPRPPGPAASDSKISELSAQLRARLSYAAAKVEQDRHKKILQLHPKESFSSRQASHLSPQEHFERSTSKVKEFQRPPSSQSSEIADMPPAIYLSSPTTHSTGLSTSPNHSAVSPLRQAQNSPGRASSIYHRPFAVNSSPKSQSARRRRPNPNDLNGRSSHISPRHRRYHSQQEEPLRTRLDEYAQNVLVPGTPPLQPSAHLEHRSPSFADSFIKPRTQVQNTIMEQDAIETLLFMSSPENSGYIASSQHKSDIPPTKKSTSEDTSTSLLEMTTSNTRNQPKTEQQLRSSRYSGSKGGALIATVVQHGLGLEAQAGDEIDRLLDQMDDSDSEKERRLTVAHFGRINNQPTQSHHFGRARPPDRPPDRPVP